MYESQLPFRAPNGTRDVFGNMRRTISSTWATWEDRPARGRVSPEMRNGGVVAGFYMDVEAAMFNSELQQTMQIVHTVSGRSRY